MTISLKIEIKRNQLLERKHNQLMSQLNRECMERHVAERLPKHFTRKAHVEYGARQRSSKWNKTKRERYKKPDRPNVASGKMLGSIVTKITHNQYGAKLRISVKQGEQLPADEWAAMTPVQRNKWLRRNTRRMANWQKREIAVLSRKEIKDERKRQAIDYRLGAMSTKFKRQRRKRTT